MGAASPPRPPDDVRVLLAALSRRIREAQALVDDGAPLPASLRGPVAGWFGRLAIGALRKLGRGLNRDQRHATHAALLALGSAGEAVNAVLARQEEIEIALWRELEEANRAREKYAEIVSYLMSTSARLLVIEERIDGLRGRSARE